MIMNDEKTIVKCGGFKLLNSSSCHGSFVMPSFDNDTIYKYRIKSLADPQVAIGIVDALFHKTDTHLYDSDVTESQYSSLMSLDRKIT